MVKATKVNGIAVVKGYRKLLSEEAKKAGQDGRRMLRNTQKPISKKPRGTSSSTNRHDGDLPTIRNRKSFRQGPKP